MSLIWSPPPRVRQWLLLTHRAVINQWSSSIYWNWVPFCPNAIIFKSIGFSIFDNKHRQMMRWKIRCPYPVSRVQQIDNKRRNSISSFPSLSAENLYRFVLKWARRNINLSAPLNFMSQRQPKTPKSFRFATPTFSDFHFPAKYFIFV